MPNAGGRGRGYAAVLRLSFGYLRKLISMAKIDITFTFTKVV